MISSRKLSALPRSQRLRKILKFFDKTERAFCSSHKWQAEDIVSISSLLDLLNSSNDFSFDEVSAISEAREIVRISHDYDAELLRAVNTVRHILLSETGQSQADWDFLDVSNQLDSRKRIVFEGMSVYLEDVRSPFNVGSMFRIAESFGVEKIMLSPLTADPLHKRAERTAMGCISAVPWERTSWEHFSEANSVFALETGGIPLKDFPFPKSGIMIVGSEELGVSPKALVCADASLGRVSIPLYGAKGSLNVSSAFAIATQAWAERLIYG